MYPPVPSAPRGASSSPGDSDSTSSPGPSSGPTARARRQMSVSTARPPQTRMLAGVRPRCTMGGSAVCSAASPRSTPVMTPPALSSELLEAPPRSVDGARHGRRPPGWAASTAASGSPGTYSTTTARAPSAARRQWRYAATCGLRTRDRLSTSRSSGPSAASGRPTRTATRPRSPGAVSSASHTDRPRPSRPSTAYPARTGAGPAHPGSSSGGLVRLAETAMTGPPGPATLLSSSGFKFALPSPTGKSSARLAGAWPRTGTGLLRSDPASGRSLQT